MELDGIPSPLSLSHVGWTSLMENGYPSMEKNQPFFHFFCTEHSFRLAMENRVSLMENEVNDRVALSCAADFPKCPFVSSPKLLRFDLLLSFSSSLCILHLLHRLLRLWFVFYGRRKSVSDFVHLWLVFMFYASCLPLVVCFSGSSTV